LTKITIIGNPGRYRIKVLKKWLEGALKNFEVSSKEILLVFWGNKQELKEVLSKYRKRFKFFSQKAQENELQLFIQMSRASYIPKSIRENGTLPIILIRKRGDILEDIFRHEAAHIKADENGWGKIGEEAYDLLWEPYYKPLSILWGQSEGATFIYALNNAIQDFFVAEIECRHGMTSEAIKENKIKLNDLIRGIKKTIRQRENLIDEKWKIVTLQLTMWAAFLTALPPSCSRKENEKQLEKVVIDLLRQISTEAEYFKIKFLISKLKFPPKAVEIYKCGAEIIELAQEFLEK